MRKHKLFVALVAACITTSTFAQTVDEIADKHVAAMGGMDKLNGVSTLVTDRSLAVQGMEIPTKTTLVIGKSLRSESTIMGNSMIQVIDDQKGWMIRPTMMGGTGEPEEMPADQIKQQLSQLDPFGGLINYKEKGNKVELIGKEKLDKKDVYHLKLTTKDGQVIEEFLDANTYLVSKVKANMNGQDGEITFSDYKDYEGIKFAGSMDITNPQMGVMTFITNKVVINSKVDDAIFKRPMK